MIQTDAQIKSKEIHTNIYNQIGGRKFAVMTGVKQFIGLDNGIAFQFKGSKVANSCHIILTPADTYTVEFFKIRGMDFKTTKTYENIYADQLQAIFTSYTGLDTSL